MLSGDDKENKNETVPRPGYLSLVVSWHFGAVDRIFIMIILSCI